MLPLLGGFESPDSRSVWPSLIEVDSAPREWKVFRDGGERGSRGAADGPAQRAAVRMKQPITRKRRDDGATEGYNSTCENWPPAC